jgi:predicted amidohydrolase YtcJ
MRRTPSARCQNASIIRFAWLLALLPLAAAAAAEPADLIVHNGRVATVDKAFAIHPAMAVTGGRVTLVGSSDAVLATRGPATVVIDLEGRLVLPGLIDSHVHPGQASMHEWDHEIPPMESIADVLAYIRARAEAIDDGDWIVVRQVFVTRLAERRYPTKAELDAAAPKNPVVFGVGPDASVSSLALSLSGIDKDFRPTSTTAKIERDPATGEPTGILRNAGQFVKSAPKSRPASEEDRDDRLEMLCRDYNSTGITGIIDRAANADSLVRFASLRGQGRLTVRVAASHSLTPADGIDTLRQKIADLAKHPLRAPSDMLRLVGLKMWLDGGMLTGSAYMREPWGVSSIYSIDDPLYRGMRFIDEELLEQIVAAASENGLQFTAHTVGDAAVSALLQAYEKTNATTPVRPLRHCLTHANFVPPDCVAQAARLGVAMDIQPVWLWLDSKVLLEQFGYDRLAVFQPLQSILSAGVIAGGGSDHMQRIGAARSVNSYDPFLGMATAITRRGRGVEKPVHPEQALSREQAIRFYTINNAHLMFLEEKTGSLEPGKLADFIVLDRDILTCPVEQIRDTKVLQTFLGGKRVFPATP